MAAFIAFNFLNMVSPFTGYSQTVKEGSYEKCFIVSDIHFDPLLGAHNDTGLYKKLERASIGEWQNIFESSKPEMTVNTALLGKDANYGVLKAALTNMKKRLPNPSFIIIAGDFIWHGAKPKDSLLKKKSIRFIAQLFKENFPAVTIIPAMGNNDTYGNDYALQDSRFLRDFADAWSPNLPKRSADKLKAQGYYNVVKGNLRFMVINSALLYYGSQYQEQADTMLTWVQTGLSNPKNKNVWIIMHIPPGLNGYNDSYMWNVDNSQTFVNSVVKYAEKVKFSIASHTHFDDFKVFYNTAQKPVAFMRIVPSICDNHSNNPSFEIAEFNSESGRVVKETSYYLNLAAIPVDKNGQDDVWEDTQGLPFSLGLGAINAVDFSKEIDHVNNDKSWKALNEYIRFYNVGTHIDSSKTINRLNYYKYLKADSLKAN